MQEHPERGKWNTGRQRWHVAPLPIFLCLAYAFLLAGWVGGDPPFAAPDEWSHYLRTIGIANGRLIGDPFAYPVASTASEHDQLTYAWINDAARLVRVPPGLFISGFDCNAGRPAESAACLYQLTAAPTETIQPTPVGNYQPLPYLLPAAVITIPSDPFAANILGRAISALVCWLCLVLALRLLWNGQALSLVGLLLAMTPMVLFIGSALTPSGLEIFSGLLFAATLVHLWRNVAAGIGPWVIAGAAGAMLALSRSTGPLYVAADIAIFLFLIGPSGIRVRLRERWWALVPCMAILALGIILSRLWERAYGSHLRIDPTDMPSQIGPAFQRVPVIVNEYVGVFGSLDTLLPYQSAFLWLLALGTLLLVALVAGSWQERIFLVLAILGNLAVIFAFSVILVVGTTFDVQGRHTLPLAVMVPLLAGEILARRVTHLPGWLARIALSSWGYAVLACGIGVFQCFAWYWNARRQGVGLVGKFRFFDRAEWYPPGGWWLWATITLLGAALIALPAILQIVQVRSVGDSPATRPLSPKRTER